jgi:hypothetical protein
MILLLLFKLLPYNIQNDTRGWVVRRPKRAIYVAPFQQEAGFERHLLSSSSLLTISKIWSYLVFLPPPPLLLLLLLLLLI